MYKKYISKVIIGGFLLVFVLSLGLYTNIIKLPIVREMQTGYAANFEDDRILMGASHYVFVGKVIEQTGTENRGRIPETQFRVSVIYNIKGSLNGDITVNQPGGYRNGMLYLIHSGDVMAPDKNNTSIKLIQPGSTYLFVSRINEEEGWLTLNTHFNALKLLSANKDLSSMELKNIAADDDKVKEFQEAYVNEILLDADISHGNTINAYSAIVNKE
jgi:hypothetical protein